MQVHLDTKRLSRRKKKPKFWSKRKLEKKGIRKLRRKLILHPLFRCLQAEVIADKLCESVSASLVGRKQSSFTRLSAVVQVRATETSKP